MKKLLLASIAVASGLFASAQYVITANKAPLAGDFDFNTVDTLPSVNKGGTGAGQSWDLSAIQAHVDNFSSWGNPSSSTFASEFPDADLLLQDAANGESFFTKANSRLTWIGLVFDIGTGPQP
ncbi:MAG TPA: hypothetical protein VFV37_09830, partial [Luteibaculaceae bacterium]|nr:hypothetical protein [Luteibaculaceae bacterium]